jgi:hypothetical protein
VHGFTDTWRTWELILPDLERRHDVLAPTLAGHAGGPPLGAEVPAATLPDALERAMDDAGFATAHSSATRSAAFSPPCNSQRAAGPNRSLRSHRPAAGRRTTTRPARRSRTSSRRRNR